MTEAIAASKGIAIDTLTGVAQVTKMSELSGLAVSAAAGWTHPGQTDASVAVDAACTGTDGDGVACALNGAGTACAVESGTCAYTRRAEITCNSDDGTGEFDVVGAEGMTCTLPTQAVEGVDITGMSCSNLQTGQILCEVPHTCAATHHPGATFTVAGPDLLPGNADDGVKCLGEGDPLTLVVADRPLNPAGCNLNYCKSAATTPPPPGYTPGDATGENVPDLGGVTCTHDGTAGAAGAAATSTNWWSEGTCLGTVDADVYGKVEGAVNDCATWPRFVITGQDADCPAGCAFDQTAATVTCTQATGEADDANDFVFTGCSQAKCNDLTGDDDSASSAFEGTNCGTGMTIKSELAFPCTGATCDQWDCCTDDDGCARITDGFDAGDTSDDNQGPCFNTNSACMDVPAPGVGNTCTCCDGDLHSSFRDALETDGGCGGNIGFFGADVTSTDANPVQGSCTACTPIANSAEEHTPPSTATDIDEPAKMVTCTRADDSRAVACVTGPSRSTTATTGSPMSAASSAPSLRSWH